MYNKTKYMREYTHKNKTKINNQRRKKLKEEILELREKRLARMKKWRLENIEYLRQYNKKQYQKDITKYSTYKKEASKRGYEFKLNYEEFLKLFHGKCNYCNLEDARGIDRFKNKKGYTLDNCVSCCMMCNRMKWRWTNEEFLEQISKIYHIANA